MKVRSLTLGDVKKALAPYDVKVSKVDGEYIVRHPTNHDADYFTNDIEDAFHTGFSFAQGK